MDDCGVQFAPGTEEKIRVLAIRYTAGLPLWHDDDYVRLDND